MRRLTPDQKAVLLSLVHILSTEAGLNPTIQELCEIIERWIRSDLKDQSSADVVKAFARGRMTAEEQFKILGSWS
jgi:hypothetical protein